MPTTAGCSRAKTFAVRDAPGKQPSRGLEHELSRGLEHALSGTHRISAPLKGGVWLLAQFCQVKCIVSMENVVAGYLQSTMRSSAL